MSDKTKVKKKPDPDIIYEGSRIQLPHDPNKMSIPDAIEALQRKQKDEETLLDVREVIEHHPHDALVAFNWAMKETYGWASPTPKMTFFGPVQPDLVTVKTGPKEHEVTQVPSGQFKLPNVSEPVETYMDFRRNRMIISGQVRKGDKYVLVQLAAKAREYLKTHSIFRGKALHVQCDDDGDPVFQSVAFLETDYIKPEQLIMNDNEYEQITASLWTPIRHTDACEKHNIPLKRGVLLEGTYGIGKTMTANVTSKICVDSGWTYILLDDVRGLKDALIFAKKYEPCVIFAEDIDRVAAERDQRGNDVLNTIDGILTKNSRIITVLTTNHVDKLDKAMLRPGRLDAVVSVRPPEEKAVKALVRLYGGNLVSADDTLDQSAATLAGNIPATIREVVERSKLAMIGRGDDHITDHDLQLSALGMQNHLDLMKAEKAKVSREEAVGVALKELLTFGDIEEFEDAMQQARDGIGEAAGFIGNETHKLRNTVHAGTRQIGEQLGDVKEDTDYIKKRV